MLGSSRLFHKKIDYSASTSLDPACWNSAASAYVRQFCRTAAATKEIPPTCPFVASIRVIHSGFRLQDRLSPRLHRVPWKGRLKETLKRSVEALQITPSRSGTERFYRVEPKKQYKHSVPRIIPLLQTRNILSVLSKFWSMAFRQIWEIRDLLHLDCELCDKLDMGLGKQSKFHLLA